MKKLKFLFFCLFIQATLFAQKSNSIENVNLIKVGKGWARNSINANILRHNAIATYKNIQYIAYYNEQQQLVVGKRKINTENWQLNVSQYKGNAADAHCTISIIVDGDGYLHVSWGHHVNKLRYCRSVKPGSLELTNEFPMTGLKEERVTYPEFYNLPNGNLLFLYRDGSSGNGSIILNRYDVKYKKWSQVQDGWINGEGERSPYWQMGTDKSGTIHLSWVWRESPDVASNHDLCYARSKDGGKTWEKSTGEKYKLPVTAATAEYAVRIPQKSELINTTAIVADSKGRPYTVTYWRSESSKVPQYQLVYHDGSRWITQQVSDRKTPFSLSGSGTKRIPISRPQLIINENKKTVKAIMIYRDIEQEDKVSVALCNDLSKAKWVVENLTAESVGLWEPSYDTALWNRKKKVHLFVQKVEQGDAETVKDVLPQEVFVLEWKPRWK
ncbi:BNR repeat-containing protein [Lacibacter sediminis]|uniref:BNR-4 repeat-containing protein n=1 Tax=Lacibacter sediminis TaxID=2760713 RepID=A0A7G5XDA3_9BACT|nr:BNR repeat-containing protein [Lacibacter sediminis]QNA43456.1 BNR-4 repeat-containing protein [Lacibacter sediminis]